MDRASESPGRDRPRGGSSKGAEDTEGRHFRDRTRVEGERSRMRWRIEIDRVAIVARDFVWLQPVIQTHDFFREDVEIPLMDGSHRGSQPALVLYEISRIFQPTSYPADRKTCNLEFNRSP